MKTLEENIENTNDLMEEYINGFTKPSPELNEYIKACSTRTSKKELRDLIDKMNENNTIKYKRVDKSINEMEDFLGL